MDNETILLVSSNHSNFQFDQVNKENLLVVSFDKLQSREVLYLPDRSQLLEIKYDENSRPVSWAPSKGSFAPTVQRYDR